MSKRLTITNIIILIIFIAGLIFVWMPKYNELKNQKVILKGKEKAIEKKNNYFSSLRVANKVLGEKKDYLEKINSALPEGISLPTIFNYIETASSENGLVVNKIESSNLDNSSAEANYNAQSVDKEGNKTESVLQKVVLSLSFSGTYPAFKNLLSEFYKSARMFEVDLISISSGKENGKEGDQFGQENKGESGIFNFRLSLEAYALPKKAPQNGDTSLPNNP